MLLFFFLITFKILPLNKTDPLCAKVNRAVYSLDVGCKTDKVTPSPSSNNLKLSRLTRGSSRSSNRRGRGPRGFAPRRRRLVEGAFLVPINDFSHAAERLRAVNATFNARVCAAQRATPKATCPPRTPEVGQPRLVVHPLSWVEGDGVVRFPCCFLRIRNDHAENTAAIYPFGVCVSLCVCERERGRESLVAPCFNRTNVLVMFLQLFFLTAAVFKRVPTKRRHCSLPSAIKSIYRSHKCIC